MSVDLRRPCVVTLRVRDLESSLAFYRDTLCLPLKLRVGGVVEIQTETFLLVLIEEDPEEADRPFEATGSSPSIGWEVDDLAEAAATLKELGVELDEPRDLGAGGRRISFRDPDGHVLELVDFGPGPADD
jgi:catechol 2,3-dioxygenase-like lactoylglutathione lyase family enzyme